VRARVQVRGDPVFWVSRIPNKGFHQGFAILGVKDSQSRIRTTSNLGPILGVKDSPGENFECVFDSELHKTLV
jgi:hypothetical protein